MGRQDITAHACAQAGPLQNSGNCFGVLIVPLANGEKLFAHGDVGGAVELCGLHGRQIGVIHAISFRRFLWWQWPNAWTVRTATSEWRLSRKTNNRMGNTKLEDPRGSVVLRTEHTLVDYRSSPDLICSFELDYDSMLALHLASWWFQLVANTVDLYGSG
jgi:hypothetical protein